MFDESQITFISQELRVNYPSMNKEDSLRLAQNMLYGMETIRQATLVDICQQIWYDCLYNSLC